MINGGSFRYLVLVVGGRKRLIGKLSLIRRAGWSSKKARRKKSSSSFFVVKR